MIALKHLKITQKKTIKHKQNQTIGETKLHPQQNTVTIRGRDNNIKIITKEWTKNHQKKQNKNGTESNRTDSHKTHRARGP